MEQSGKNQIRATRLTKIERTSAFTIIADAKGRRLFITNGFS
jgi:hypothetical protein